MLAQQNQWWLGDVLSGQPLHSGRIVSAWHGPLARPPGETGTGGSPQSQQAALTQEVAGGWLCHVGSVSARSQGGAPFCSRGDHMLPVVLESGSPCSAHGLAFCSALGKDRRPSGSGGVVILWFPRGWGTQGC